MVIEQFLPAFHYGDAVGNMVLKLHDFFLKRGVESRIIAFDIDKSLKSKATLFEDYEEVENSIKVLHFAVPSDLTWNFRDFKGKKVMIYHNVTPYRFFCDYSEEIVKLTYAAKEHLEGLRDSLDEVIAVSEFNASGLKELGYGDVKVLPVLLELEDFEKPYSKGYYNLFKDGRKNILFVGRIVPNKKIEDLIRMIFFYKKYFSPSIRLIVAGNPGAIPKYYHALRDYAGRLLLTSDDVVFTGHISFEELLSVYASADLFASMSEHEGFFVPMFECFKLKIPVMAYDGGAVSETAGDGAILFNSKRCDKTAGLAEAILSNEEIRHQMIKNGSKRLGEYIKNADPQKFLEVLERV